LAVPARSQVNAAVMALQSKEVSMFPDGGNSVAIKLAGKPMPRPCCKQQIKSFISAAKRLRKQDLAV
jgi:hypothetical protein